MNNLFNQKILAKKAEEEVDLSKHNFSERRKALNKWINNLENGVLDKSKEEEFQGEFLYDIFTTVLRAVNKSDGKNEWNLERETKTKLDGQKADGVLGFFDADGKKDVRAVIELKGAKVSLDVRQKRIGDTRTPVEQAFNYAPKYGKNCQWVIVSNYKEIRLYRSNDMTEYQVFFLEKLKDDLEFKKFIYILSFYALVGTEKKKAKTIELSEEYQKNQSEIEKKFYNEYKTIRLHIFENMRKNNPTVNENTIIEKVQKLLDRFLFICFCEDKGLLPNNIFHKTLEKGKNFGDVFEVFKMLCNWINLGNPRKNISHFNGGLFKNDDILESLYVDNEVFEEMKKISEYDFDSELNENILGHIFEQSISDIEDLKKELNGEEFDKKKGKRKKDGIFYTPKYITKYIVENSIKNWLDDKRKELGEDKLPELTEKDFEIEYTRKKSEKKTYEKRIYSENLKKHIEFWTKYREAVKNIKIVDPACGSGAFLITAFEYLLNYNNYLNDKIFDLTGVKDLFSDTTKEILQNNIFGVDLNKESVEITKLSLWLKTADKNKTLATLENNIKCGNSLIDDAEIAGEMAFDWEKEFPQVFKNGGFDVVVGNPPYFNVQTFGAKSPIVSYLMDKYSEIWQDKSDILFYFIYKALKISKGEVGFIISNAFLFSDKAQKLRNYIVEKGRLEKIINFEKYMIFEEASITSCIVMFGKENRKVKGINLKEKNYSNDEILKYLNGNKEYEIELKKDDVFAIVDKQIQKLNTKIDENNPKLQDLVIIGKGMETAANDIFLFESNNLNFPNEFIKNHISGEAISKYTIKNSQKKLLYFENIENFEDLPIEIKEYLEKNREKLNDRATVKNEGRIWWRYSRPMHKEYYHLNKIWCSYRSTINEFCYDDTKEYIGLTNTTVIFDTNEKIKLKYLLTILNSKLFKFRYSSIGKQTGSGVYEYFANGVGKFPIKEISLQKQEPFIEKADKMLALNKELQEISQKFQRMIMRELGLEKISTKLQNWYLLNFDKFIKELSKAKVKLSLSQKADWEDYFIAEKSKAETLNNEITKTDKEIDGMVYKLYGLSEEEVRIVES